MNPFQWEVTCSVCGGKAMAIEPASFLSSERHIHNNPNVCREVLARKAEDLTRREEALKAKETKESCHNKKCKCVDCPLFKNRFDPLPAGMDWGREVRKVLADHKAGTILSVAYITARVMGAVNASIKNYGGWSLMVESYIYKHFDVRELVEDGECIGVPVMFE